MAIDPSPSPAPLPDPATTVAKIEADLEVVTGAAAQVAAAVAADTTISGWQAFKAICVSLPILLVMLQQFAAWIKRMGGDDPKTFLVNLGKQMTQLSNANTEAQDADAGGSISDGISHLPSH